MVSRFPRLYTISDARNFDEFCRFIIPNTSLRRLSQPARFEKRPRLGSIDSIESCGENRRSFDMAGSHTNSHSDPIEVSEYAPSSPIRVSKTFDTRNFTPAPSPATPNCPDSPKKKPSKKKRGSVTKAKKLAAGLVQITLKELPENWDIPRDRKVAYLVDLQDDTTSYLDEKGNPLSMAAIIKNACTDSYGDGSCGSKKEPTLVPALGNIHRQNNTQEREDNQAQSGSYFAQAAAFFNMVGKRKCPFNEGNYTGRPKMFTLAPLSEDGKRNYIGCSAKVPSDPFLSHTYIRIPACVNEDILQHLFDNIPADEEDTEAFEGHCSCIFLPCIGFKRQGCYNIHYRNNQLFRGTIKRRPCNARLTIYSPVNRSIRKAIVIPTQDRPHNHPSFPSAKLTYQGKTAYQEAIRRAGIIGATVHKVDNAVSTPAIFNNEFPQAVFPALGDCHIKNEILMREKKRHCPNGVGFLGVVAAHMEDMKKNPEDRYIHYVQTEPSSDGNGNIEVVVTMNAKLAQELHSARASLYDNTYKRVLGAHNEWEAVIWNDKLNCRLNVARIYCNRESREAFKLMWLAYFRTVERVTGQKLRPKAFHMGGLMAVILTDGCAAQALGLGDALLELIDPSDRAFAHTAEEIIQHILRTCWVHARWNLHHLKGECSDEEFQRLSRFRNISSDAELKAFEQFCLSHSSVKIQDWCKQKMMHTWLWPSLIKNFSKIPSEDWDLNRADTNLNEGSHPQTNRATGTSLTLLEAIEMARDLDERKAEELELAKKLCLLPNRHNTDEHRYMNNGSRAVACLQKTVTHKAKEKTLSDIDAQLLTLRAKIKSLTRHKQGIKKGTVSLPEPVEPMHYNTDLHLPPPPPSAEMVDLVRSTLHYATSGSSFNGSVNLSPALYLPPSFGGQMPDMSDIDSILFPSSTAPH
ncbi:hypothetical protein M422DRAFT_254378 [Sphaerobolus stellatus SS14]|uniref:Uncharacterized protein n=1 Tax=Sphaerobolus stellatus (strain SS14) TaxID=990650 RepID=A0A0C9VWA0_SPHS4|nr:hypothetical protein M422DRAFT_254378 [Sphaerobolus stellatus SS14]